MQHNHDRDIATILVKLRPRGAPTALRERVLADIAKVLSHEPGDQSAITEPAADAFVDARTSVGSPFGPTAPAKTQSRRRAVPLLLPAVIASTVLCVFLNWWVMRQGDRRIAEIMKPQTPSRSEMIIAEQTQMIRETSGDAAADSFHQQMQRLAERSKKVNRHTESPEAFRLAIIKYYCQITELAQNQNLALTALTQKGIADETLKKNSQMDRNHSRKSDGGAFIDQRHLGLENRCASC